MNPYFDLVDRLKLRAERFAAAETLSGGLNARPNRGKVLPDEKIEALIWGLSHPSPVVRRCCLELLDQHPDPRAVPHIVRALEDPVPRVRWHAVHALACDACKAGQTFLSASVEAAIARVAEADPNPRVRAYAEELCQRPHCS